MNTKAAPEVLPLTSLRFFLATWIVIFHLNVILRGEQNTAASTISPLMNVVFCAYVAVGIFFVLSGFILALNYLTAGPWTHSMRINFAVARISRICPVYLLALCAVSPILIGEPLIAHSWSLLLRHLGSGVLNLLMLQAWIPRAALTWNGPGWSISTEAFFYVIFPIIGVFFFRIATIHKAMLTLAGLWALLLAPPFISIFLSVPGYGELVAIGDPSSDVASFVRFNPLLNLPFFLSGIVACKCFLIFRASGKFSGKGYLFYLPGLVTLSAATSMGNHVPYPLMHNGLMLPAAIAIIIGLSLGDRYLCALLSTRWLVFLGKASYAEYLLHFPIRAAFEWLGTSWSPLQQVIYLLTVLAVSAFVYLLYENPMQSMIRSFLRPRAETTRPRSLASASPQ
jgi:peptidoglycan/LPS O-acetylase OafA/YrhL